MKTLENLDLSELMRQIESIDESSLVHFFDELDRRFIYFKKFSDHQKFRKFVAHYYYNRWLESEKIRYVGWIVKFSDPFEDKFLRIFLKNVCIPILKRAESESTPEDRYRYVSHLLGSLRSLPNGFDLNQIGYVLNGNYTENSLQAMIQRIYQFIQNLGSFFDNNIPETIQDDLKQLGIINLKF